MSKFKNEPFAKALSQLISMSDRGVAGKCARSAGVSSGYFSELKRGVKEGKEEKRRLIANYFNFSYDDFLSLGEHLTAGGTYEEWRTSNTPQNSSRYEKTNSSSKATNTPELSEAYKLPPARRIPVISWVQAGDFCGIEEIDISGVEQWVNCYRKVSDNSFALVVRGNSMEPEFKEGDNIVIDPAIPAETGKYVVAKIEDHGADEEATFKQFVKDGGQVFLRPLNDAYPVIDMTGKKFTICGCVVQKSKDY